MVAQAKEAGCPSFKKYFNEFVCLADESCQFAAIGYDSEQSVGVAQLVRASDCGSECRGFESPHPPSSSAFCRALTTASHISVCPVDRQPTGAPCPISSPSPVSRSLSAR